MAKATPITVQFQHFVRDLKESFWGDLYGKTPLAWERFGEEESGRARDQYLVAASRDPKGNSGSSPRQPYVDSSRYIPFARLR